MQTIFFICAEIYQRVIGWFERLTASKYWILKATVLIIVMTVLFHGSPAIDWILQPGSETFDAVQIKAQDLTYDLTLRYPPENNSAKLNFRLVMPILSAIFQLSRSALYIVQVCFGIGVIYLTLRIARRLSGDPVVAILIGILVATTYAGETGFVEARGRFDAVSLFFLLLALASDKPIVILFAIFVAGWNDERGLIASSLVFTFYFMTSTGLIQNGVRAFLRRLFTPQLLAVVAAWVLYFITRLALSRIYNISTPSTEALDHILHSLNWLPLGLWTAFEGGWLLIIAASVLLFIHKTRIAALMLLVSLSVILVVAFSVIDISRSTAYALPAIFIAIWVLKKYSDQQSLRVVTFVSALIASLWPMYYLETGLTWYYPLVLRFLIGLLKN